jgi:glycerol-3-phosphate acyltransferase PlsX
MVRIGLDMMGGDFAPTEAIKGLLEFFKTDKPNLHIVAIGDASILQDPLSEIRLEKITIVHSESIVGMHEHPTKAFKEKPKSSIAVSYELLKEGKIDALISAGNTGAMLVGAHFSIKPIEGIIRPAIGAFFPRLDGSIGLLCDVGLNADCKPENLVQFAVLSTIFAKEVLKIGNPKVGIINIGEEEGKGNILTQETYGLLKNYHSVNFVGNIEGRDVFSNKTDVMVCDGFTGNVVLKMAEQLFEIAKERKINDDFFNKCDFETYGGSPILGLSKPVIIGHGISHAKAFTNMIDIAIKMVESNVMGKMEKVLV